MKKISVVFLLVIAAVFFYSNMYALETYCPHITGGSALWNDYLQANNNTSTDADFTLTLYDANGTQVYSQVHSVAALSRLEIEPKVLRPAAKIGKITYDEPGLNFRISYVCVNGGVAEFKTIGALNSSIGLYFSDYTPSVVAKGATIANFGVADADVTLYAIGGGEILDQQVVQIGQYQKINGLHTTWFPGVDFEDIESILAVAAAPSICGIAICADANTSHLLFTPAAPVHNYFNFQTSDWELAGEIDSGEVFTVTADAVFKIEGDTVYATITTKEIEYFPEPQTITVQGTIDGNTWTFTDQTSPGGVMDGIKVNGVIEMNGNTLTATGAIEPITPGGTLDFYETFEVTGTKINN